MKRTAAALRIVVRAFGALHLILGVLIWTGMARPLVAVHMLVGLVLVLCLWALAALGARSGAHPGRVALAVAWGLFVPVFGVVHGALLVGEWRWVIQVLHLLVGVALLGQAEALARSAVQGRVARPADAPARVTSALQAS